MTLTRVREEPRAGNFLMERECCRWPFGEVGEHLCRGTVKDRWNWIPWVRFLGWVVGWANSPARAGAAGKARRIRARNSFRACLPSWSRLRRSRSITAWIRTTNLTGFLSLTTYWF